MERKEEIEIVLYELRNVVIKQDIARHYNEMKKQGIDIKSKDILIRRIPKMENHRLKLINVLREIMDLPENTEETKVFLTVDNYLLEYGKMEAIYRDIQRQTIN